MSKRQSAIARALMTALAMASNLGNHEPLFFILCLLRDRRTLPRTFPCQSPLNDN
jgi:hypothetical protein